MNVTFRTLAICGSHLEHVYYHDRGVKYGERSIFASGKKNDKKQEYIREDSLHRTKKMLRRFIWCNESYLKTFLSLTFRGNENRDLMEANKKFQNFIKKMNHYYPDFLYIGVPEYQKRGVVHYHLLTNIEYLSNAKLSKIWGFGFVSIKSAKKIKHLAKYMTKYLTKGNIGADSRFFNKKKIFYSFNIKRPIIKRDWDEIESFINYFTNPDDLLYEKMIEVPYMGRMTYALYKMGVDYFGPPTPEEEYKHLIESMIE